MYYQNYEDYMRKILGYSTQNSDTYPINHFENSQDYTIAYQNTKELESYYPEIYKIINPIVCEICDNVTEPVTRNILEEMVEKVYKKVEIKNEIAIKINIDNSIERRIETKNPNLKQNFNKISNNEQIRKNNIVESRQKRSENPFLSDIIRILILNKLLSENNNINNNFYSKPPIIRPPFPMNLRLEPNRNNEDYF